MIVVFLSYRQWYVSGGGGWCGFCTEVSELSHLRGTVVQFQLLLIHSWRKFNTQYPILVLFFPPSQCYFWGFLCTYIILLPCLVLYIHISKIHSIYTREEERKKEIYHLSSLPFFIFLSLSFVLHQKTPLRIIFSRWDFPPH